MKRLLFVSQFGKIMQESRRAREFLVRHKGSLFYIFLDIFYNKKSIHVVFFILFFVKQSQRQRRVDPFREKIMTHFLRMSLVFRGETAGENKEC